jgi:murein DD-endopeptidase MepM/ murein hydrolase activator NlpD
MPAATARCITRRWGIPAACAVLAIVVASCGGDRSEPALPDLEFMRFPDPATSPYCLPYPVGQAARVSQPWSGAGTHRGRFAIDFAMPVGSTVTAARGGLVTETRTQYSDDDRTGGHENGVFVLHDDGTMATYLHMGEDGVLVDVDDTVTVGTPIGLVGTTGTSVPHLHFEVFEGQGDSSQWYRSVPVSFANAHAPLDEWGGLMRTAYEAGPCATDG